MKERKNILRIAATASLGVAVAIAVGFALADSQGTFATDAATERPATGPLLETAMRSLREQASSLDRSRTRDDELPPKLEEMLAGLPDQVPGAADQSMRVLSAAGVGDMYVAPSATGFAILATVGFAGTVPGGLSDANPVAGGTAVLPSGRLVLLGIASDEVSEVLVRLRGVEHRADRSGNGVWWIAPGASPDPDELAVTARFIDGRTVRVF